ncbi:Vacuolar protein sorting-associated protein 41-like protein [Auxenochlorella protothecoides]|uniref:Vacuolar protein sorting-associated protein 41-like protein n=1 Tax=Auxenochlorella protothecoides TaxID=3075 RepID=A0A087SAF2_AUXPR|nr:Vacuolar protein sorting-associated protein 41-like protein [Auxenochlorella protothecoides]KFM22706.1 Vacuolar protein sorting-associated protein 41-like protein [Auxenochlorella protothecoides]
MAQEVDSSDEPRLKYSALSPDTSIPGTALLLAVSDKVLALGTSTGAVLVLDYNGNQVQAFKEHHAAVTDLSFDAEAEYLASCSADGWVVIYGLYTGDIRRHNCHQPLTTVALDPRYSERKTREFVHGSQSGTLTLISKGWLGSSETPLFRGRGAVQVARMAGTLLAWVTATGLRVYDTATHTRLAKIPAPKTPAGEAAAPASLLWLGIRELYVGWGRTVLVLRVVRDSLVPSASSSAASAYSVPALRMETVVSIQVPFSVAGLAPFGVELAVLGTAVESLLGKGEAGGAKGSKPADGPVPPAPRFLHVLDRSGRILSSDELDVGPGATLAVFYTESAHRASEAVEKGTGLAPTLVLEALPKGGDSRVAGAGAADAGTASSEPSSDASALPGAPDENASHDSPSDRGSSHPAASANASPAATTVDTASPVHALPTPHPVPPATPPPALSQPYKWWRDGDEPLYFLTSGSGTVVGRPRDGNDRVAWMMERGRIAEALAVAESDATVTRPVREAVGEQYLQYLVDRDEWAATAAAAPRLLQGRALAWERWVHVFAGARELRRLAPHLPVSEPQLRTRTYDMVLQALLVSPNDHGLLLDLVRRWPASTYSVRDVQRAVLSRLAAAGTGPCALDDVLTPGAAPDPRRADLMRAAVELHVRRGQHAPALALLLKLRDPGAFDYAERHALLAAAGEAVPDLFRLDAARAAALCVARPGELPPASVLRQLAAAAEARPAERDAWRRRAHEYLAALSTREPALAAEHAALAVELTAEYDPAALEGLLLASSDYPLEEALRVCEARGMVPEQVLVLGRMGATDRALRLIVENLRDVGRAVEFVQNQRDDELWDLLITLALADPELTGALLDHAGGGVDPLAVVSRLPRHAHIPRLSQRLGATSADEGPVATWIGAPPRAADDGEDEHEIEEAGVNASKAPPASRLSPLRRKPSRRLSGGLKAA